MTDLLKALLSADSKPEKSVPMTRFGADVTFKIRAVSVKERDALREQATRPLKGGKTQFDANEFAASLLVKGVVEPNLADAALVEKYGPTPNDVPANLLLPGEYDRLFTQILELSGVVNEDDAVDEIKN